MIMLYLAGVIISFFLSILLITKRNKSGADYILFAWLSITGFQLLAYYHVIQGLHLVYPSLFVLSLPIPMVMGPFLYLYTCQETTSDPFIKKQLLHFLPALILYFWLSGYFFLPLDQKIEIIRQHGRGYENFMLVKGYAILVSGIVYITLSVIRLRKYRMNLVHQFSNTDKINFTWLFYLIVWMAVIWLAVIFVHDDKVVFGCVALDVIWLGYFGIKQVRVFSQGLTPLKVTPIPQLTAGTGESEYGKADNYKETDSEELVEMDDISKYQKSTLTEKNASEIYNRLRQLFLEQKPYKNPELTLNELAKSLAVHPNHLSQVINSIEKKNFYDLINEKRVEEFIELNSRQVNQKYTLLALAFDCGFNSKASFNRNFKKYTGFTPSHYLKKQLAD
jgi:AraC-like DNA-binding protein